MESLTDIASVVNTLYFNAKLNNIAKGLIDNTAFIHLGTFWQGNN